MKWLKLLKKHWKLLLVILYLVSPIDLIPDAILPTGLADDTIVVIATLANYLRNREKDNLGKALSTKDRLKNLKSALHGKKENVQDGEIVEDSKA